MLKRKILCFSLMTVFLLIGTLGTGASCEEELPCVAKWTVMYYMCCDSNMQPHAETLLENLSKIGSKNDFNILALYDGVPCGDSKIIYFAETGERINLNEELGWPIEFNYANQFTFEKFVKDIMNYFPAEYYALLIYGSGGAGWQMFHLQDSAGTYGERIYKGKPGLTTPQTGNAFRNITNNGEEKIDAIYTSCAMNTIELAWELSPYVDYMIGTQDCLSRDFEYRYYESVWELCNNTDMTPAEFSEYSSEILKPKSFYYQLEWEDGLKTLNNFFNKRSNEKLQTVKHYDNVGVIDNSNIDGLIESIDELSRYLIVSLEDEEIMSDVSYAREHSRESSKCFAKPKSPIMHFLHKQYRLNFTAYSGVIDLYDFCEELNAKTDDLFLKEYCSEVMENINKTVPYLKKIDTDQIHGLNIYFPREKNTYNKYVSVGEMPCLYEELAFCENTCWDEFLKEYLAEK